MLPYATKIECLLLSVKFSPILLISLLNLLVNRFSFRLRFFELLRDAEVTQACPFLNVMYEI